MLWHVLACAGMLGHLHAQTAHYRPLAGATLPDSTITPGELRPDATVTQLCTMSTRQFRQVTRAQKDSVYALYGARRAGGGYQVDHVIPLGLGGSNSVRNLWPQSFTKPGAHEKDALEFALYNAVCTGKLPLEKAQRAIRVNWYAAYLLWSAGVWP